MRRIDFGWIAILIGALGFPGAARAQDFGSSAFTSEAQAERYLRQNPTGPQAKAAFLAIVEFQLARKNPGFSRSDIASRVNLDVVRGSDDSGRDFDRDDGQDQY